MSTGAECYFYEEKPGKWFYKLQRWPYGEWPEYDKFGPFPMFEAAKKHLDRNHANPGGYSVNALEGCRHDLLEPRDGDERWPAECRRCGKFLSAEDAEKSVKQ